MRRTLTGAAAVALLGLFTASASAQLVGQKAEAIEQARVRRLSGLVLPSLPPVTASSPRDQLIFADRQFVNQSPTTAPGDTGPVLVSHTIPSGTNGTGTPFNETFWYQLPTNYVSNGDPRPLVIGYHGYGASAATVANQSTIDEECEARGWIYMAPTGLDDKIIGALACQQHIERAIQYMLDNFVVDPDRIFMIGFSAGGCVCTNFASRHRDPAGMMVAAVVSVSGSFDITLTYANTTPTGKSIMENVWVFGGTPTQFPFRYQQCSTLYATPGTYPPIPGTNDPVLSMGDNLHNTPLYLTWDIGDPLVEKPQLMGPQLGNLVANAGGSVQVVQTTHTIDPITHLSAPHSWAVLNEADAFNFLADKVLVRTPAAVVLQADHNGPVSYTDTAQAVAEQFTWLNAIADAGTLSLTDVVNAAQIDVDVATANLSGIWPLHLVAESADNLGFGLTLGGFNQPPGYVLNTADGTLLTGVTTDPFTGTMTLTVPPSTTLDLQVQSEPWLAKIWSTPQPALLGGGVTLNFDAPAANAPPTAFLVISLSELLTPIKGGHMITASLPAGMLLLPLDGNADLSFSGTVGTDAALSGLHVLFQALAMTSTGDVDSISNLWSMSIQ